MNLIVAVDKNWAIGKNNKLLIQIPQDQKYFREKTTNNVIVMGRKTLESFPGGRPLANRTNIVVTSNKDYKADNVTLVNTIEEALEEIKKYPPEKVYIIGGQTIYEQFVDYCDTAYITKINYAYDADTHFPNIDKKEGWELEATSEELTYHDIEYTFNKYVNSQAKKF